MTKIAFIGAGSFGFTRGLVRDILTFPLLEGRDARPDGHRPGAAGLRPAGGAAHRRPGQVPRQGRGHDGPRRGPEGRRRRARAPSSPAASTSGSTTSSSRRSTASTPTSATRAAPSGIFRALRTIPVMLDIAKDMEQLLPRRHLLNYTNPMAMLCRAMQRETLHPAHRPLPQRPGHGEDAGQLDRRADGRDHLRLRRHQPPGVVPQLRVERQGCLPADPQGRDETPGDLQRGAGPQRDVPALRTTTSPSRAATTPSTTGGSASGRT